MTIKRSTAIAAAWRDAATPDANAQLPEPFGGRSTPLRRTVLKALEHADAPAQRL